MEKKKIASAHLLKLKEILFDMISQNRISEAEALNILRKAGLIKLPEADGWMDEEGSTYRKL
jgi:ABC-type metal ion transport system substrate-binding protein